MKIQEKGGKFVIVDFNELEAYKIAIKIEKDGIDFYKKIFVNMQSKEIKEKLEFLLNEEREHLKFFEECLFNAGQHIEDGFQEDDLLNYMDYGIFKPLKDLKKMAKKIDDIKKALRLGIAVEEKSIRFYEFCRDKVSLSGTKDELKNIIAQEKQHRFLFKNILKSIESRN